MSQHVTRQQLDRLKEAASLANSAYDAARKQFKKQQKQQDNHEARTSRLGCSQGKDPAEVH